MKEPIHTGICLHVCVYCGDMGVVIISVCDQIVGFSLAQGTWQNYIS